MCFIRLPGWPNFSAERKKATGKNCFSNVCPLHSTGLKQTNNARIAILAVVIFAADQLTKLAVLNFLPAPGQSEIHVLPGFFTLVHWQNSGAAWSMFHNNNIALGIISAIALVVLIFARKKFGSETAVGSIALG